VHHCASVMLVYSYTHSFCLTTHVSRVISGWDGPRRKLSGIAEDKDWMPFLTPNQQCQSTEVLNAPLMYCSTALGIQRTQSG